MRLTVNPLYDILLLFVHALSTKIIAKIYIARKESLETIYWLELLYCTDYLDCNQYNSLQNYCIRTA